MHDLFFCWSSRLLFLSQKSIFVYETKSFNSIEGAHLLVIFITLGIIFGYIFIDLILGIIFYFLNPGFVKSAKAVPGRYAPVEKLGVTTFVTDKGLRILSIADTHIGAGILCGNEDRYALLTIKKIINKTRPDLVVVAGDIIYTTKFQTFNNDNIKAMRLVAGLFEALEVYWAPIFGNHDSEEADYTRQQLGEYLENEQLKYCLFKCGANDIDGVGNYLINIENTKGEITRTLYLMDTNEYLGAGERLTKADTKYDNVHENQIVWYDEQVKLQNAKNESIGAAAPKSLLFIHIPLPQYKLAAASGNVVYGKQRENMCPGKEYGFFDKIVELDSTEAVYCGHDHTNDFAIEYKGVVLSYSRSIDFLAYIWTKFFNPGRGGTVIELEGRKYTAVCVRPSGEKAAVRVKKTPNKETEAGSL